MERHDFFTELSKQRTEVYNTISGYVSASYYAGATNDEQFEFMKTKLAMEEEKIFVGTTVALEALGLHSSLGDLKVKFEMIPDKDKGRPYPLPYVDAFTSKVLDIVEPYIAILGAGRKDDQDDEDKLDAERARIRSILESTPHILHDQGIEPHNEAAVKAAIFAYLRIMYADTIREFSIGQEIKTFKPDMGNRSLKLAIEYKFADTEAEVKNSVDGIFADIHGYDRSGDWQYFYSVIYQTQPFVTPAQIESQFAAIEDSTNWRCILVTGTGNRLKKAQDSGASKKKSAPKKKAAKKKTATEG